MGKAGKDRKRRRLLAEVTATGVGAHHMKDDQENIDSSVDTLEHSKNFGGIVSDEDMATTLRTLLALEQHTDVFRSKACKALRAVVHQLQQTATATTGMGRIINSSFLPPSSWPLRRYISNNMHSRSCCS